MAFGFVPAYLVYTPASWFEIKGIPHIPVNFIAILDTLALMSGFITAAYHIITPLTIDFSDLTDRAIENLTEMSVSVGQVIENNILNPNIVGGNVNISPFFYYYSPDCCQHDMGYPRDAAYAGISS